MGMTNDILKSWKREDGKRSYKSLRVIKYTNDEGKSFIRLEKVEFFKDGDKVREFGKIKGLTMDDLAFIFQNKDEIVRLMGATRAAAPAADYHDKGAAVEQDF